MLCGRRALQSCCRHPIWISRVCGGPGLLQHRFIPLHAVRWPPAPARQLSSRPAMEARKTDQDTVRPKSLNYGLEHPLTQIYMRALQLSRSTQPGKQTSSVALQEFQKALDMALADGGPNCLEHATILIDMAREHAKLGNPTAAVACASQGLPVFEQYWGKDHRVYAEAAFDMACFYALEKKPQEALDLMYACRGTFLRQFGPEHQRTQQLLKMMHALERQPRK
mmetsp:Transcript_75425/g.143594  ORF Transcript_75425/g.143594 Transcript_75425/m.143594 type:complete len:224 (+) Transcript_75425:46-717(+)